MLLYRFSLRASGLVLLFIAIISSIQSSFANGIYGIAEGLGLLVVLVGIVMLFKKGADGKGLPLFWLGMTFLWIVALVRLSVNAPSIFYAWPIAAIILVPLWLVKEQLKMRGYV